MGDIQILARAVLATFNQEDEEPGRYASTICVHCSGKVPWDVPMEAKHHDSSCPVLVAEFRVLGYE